MPGAADPNSGSDDHGRSAGPGPEDLGPEPVRAPLAAYVLIGTFGALLSPATLLMSAGSKGVVLLIWALLFLLFGHLAGRSLPGRPPLVPSVPAKGLAGMYAALLVVSPSALALPVQTYGGWLMILGAAVTQTARCNRAERGPPGQSTTVRWVHSRRRTPYTTES